MPSPRRPCPTASGPGSTPSATCPRPPMPQPSGRRFIKQKTKREKAMSEAVLLTLDGPIATVTLNRPEAYNSLNAEMTELLNQILPKVERNPDVKVVILNGNGPAFMAGGDIKSFAKAMGMAQEEKRGT